MRRGDAFRLCRIRSRARRACGRMSHQDRLPKSREQLIVQFSPKRRLWLLVGWRETTQLAQRRRYKTPEPAVLGELTRSALRRVLTRLPSGRQHCRARRRRVQARAALAHLRLERPRAAGARAARRRAAVRRATAAASCATVGKRHRARAHHLRPVIRRIREAIPARRRIQRTAIASAAAATSARPEGGHHKQGNDAAHSSLVLRAGIEPATRGFSVMMSSLQNEAISTTRSALGAGIQIDHSTGLPRTLRGLTLLTRFSLGKVPQP